MSLSNNITELTKEQFIELLSPTITLTKKDSKTPSEITLELLEDVQETIVRTIHDEIKNEYDEYLTEYNDVNWQYTLDNDTKVPYFYFEYKDYSYCLFTYELASNEQQFSDINTNLLCIALFYDNLERFYPSTLTNKVIEILKESASREEKLILSFITNLKLVS